MKKIYCYLIYDKQTKLTKIGKSINPIKRIKQLKTGNSNLNLLFYSDKYLEHELQEKYSKFRVSGEWFKLGLIELKEIIGNNKNIPKTFFYIGTMKKISYQTVPNKNTITISKTYTLIFELDFDSNYKVSKCGKIFNIKRNTEVKRVLNGGSFGYWIDKKFYTLKIISSNLIKHTDSDCPF